VKTKSSIEIKWDIADGYVGNRPHYTSIDAEDLCDCDTEEEVRDFVEEYIEESFRQQISFEIEDSQMDAAIAVWKKEKGTKA
jgi:hypothetical protein